METKTCTRCLNPKPLDQFRRRGRNDPRPAAHCHECHRLAIQMFRDRQRFTTVKQFVRAVEKADDDIKLVQAAKAAMSAFRGPEGFSKAMVATYEAALPGSPTRGKLIAAIMHMMEGSDRRTYVDKSCLSDEDLDREMAAFEQRIAGRILAARDVEAVSGEE